MDGEECGACGVAVPQSKLELAREGDDLVYCGNCGRILWSE
jgi:predicted  nucleic acid-binding Zn-ribbon protein